MGQRDAAMGAMGTPTRSEHRKRTRRNHSILGIGDPQAFVQRRGVVWPLGVKRTKERSWNRTLGSWRVCLKRIDGI